MDLFTPQCDISAIPHAEGVELGNMAENLFKNTPAPVAPEEKLQAFLRIRPVNDNNQSKKYFIVDGTNLITRPPSESRAFKTKGVNNIREFNFNRIFDESASQEDFYERCALPMTIRTLKGESSLLFAYGTTNSGKSFTMRGTTPDPGVIPRALSTLFTCLGDRVDFIPFYRASRFAEAEQVVGYQSEDEIMVRNFISEQAKGNPRSSQSMVSFRNISISSDATKSILEETLLSQPTTCHTRFSIWVSFVEFYMENIKDLLAVDTGTRPQQLMLVPDSSNNYFVRGLRRVSVSTAEEAFHCLLYGWDNLHRATTTLNKDSSRSHCIFTISVVGYDEPKLGGKLKQVSNLSFCDLAGSERGDRTNNKGDRLKEAAKINNSLSVLGRCIAAIRGNQKKKTNKHVVPFRESTLTKYFQSYFNGTGMASMIININPAVEYYDETMVTLQFSAEASDITVSNAETKKRLAQSVLRLTQQWMHSTQRWSSVQAKKPASTPEFTLLTTTEEEDEVDDSEFTNEMNTLEASLLECEDQEELNKLIQQIDDLHERLKSCEHEKFEMEAAIRKQVWEECRVMNKQMKEEERTKRNDIEKELRQKISDLRKAHREEMKDQQKLVKSLEEKVTYLEEELENQQRNYLRDQEEKTELIPHTDDLDSEKVQEKVAEAVAEAVNQAKSQTESEINNLKSSLDVKTKENDKILLDLKILNESLTSKTQEVNTLMEERDSLLKTIQETKSNLTQREDKIEELQASVDEFIEREDQLRQALSLKETELASICQEKESLVIEVRGKDQEIVRLNDGLEQQLRANELLEQELASLQTRLSEKESEVEILNNRLKENNHVNEDIDRLSTEKEALVKERKELESEVTQLKSSLMVQKEETENARIEVIKLQKEALAKETQSVEVISKLNLEIQDWKHKFDSQEAKLNEKEKRIDELEVKTKIVVNKCEKSPVLNNSGFSPAKNNENDSNTNLVAGDVRVTNLLKFTPVKDDDPSPQGTLISATVKKQSVDKQASQTSMEENSSQDNGNTSMRTTRQRNKQLLNNSSSSNQQQSSSQEIPSKRKSGVRVIPSSSRGITEKLSSSQEMDIRVTSKRKASNMEPSLLQDAYLQTLKKTEIRAVGKIKKPRTASSRDPPVRLKKKAEAKTDDDYSTVTDREDSTHDESNIRDTEDDEDELTQLTQTEKEDSDAESGPESSYPRKKSRQQKRTKRREVLQTPATVRKATSRKLPMDKRCLVNSISPIRQKEDEAQPHVLMSGIKTRNARGKRASKDTQGKKLFQ